MRTLLALTLLVAPATANAQYRIEPPAGEPSEADIDRARELFGEGGSLADGGRWADALSAFEESYRLSGIPAALFNAATTLRSMGRHRDARDLFQQVLDLPDLDEETHTQSEARMREEAGRVALILLTGVDDAPDAQVELDGRTIEDPERDPLELETDAGEHAVAVIREGYVPWREEVTLEDGDRVSLRAELVAIEVEGENFLESPILWTIVAIVLAGGGVLGGVLGYDAAQLSPREEFDSMVVNL